MPKNYIAPQQDHWNGRSSNDQQYLHEKIKCLQIDDFINKTEVKPLVLLGYASDAGVEYNRGRIGASKGPDAIRQQLGKMTNHLSPDTLFLDLGNLTSPNGNVEAIQEELSKAIDLIALQGGLPLILGGGHDLAYGHFKGLTKQISEDKIIGIINFDAHFDFRPNTKGNNSGTPFYQIAVEHRENNKPFKYLAMGIRKEANTKSSFEFAEST